jgi:hypothetical protein
MDRIYFYNNYTDDTYWGKGNAIYIDQSEVNISHAVFVDNYGGSGVINNDGGDLTLVNSTIAGNQGSTSGGLVNVNYGNMKLVNTILWENKNNDGEIDNFYSVEENDTISYSVIEGSGGSSNWNTDFGFDGGNNIDSDPLLFDFRKYDVSIFKKSPALRTGNSIYGSNIGYDQGTGIDEPQLNISKNSLTFSDTRTDSSSVEMFFSVSATGLYSPIEIIKADGFEISFVSNTYLNKDTLELDTMDRAVTETEVYVRFSPSEIKQYEDSILISTQGYSFYMNVFGIGYTDPEPMIKLLQTSLTFENTVVGDNSTEKYFVVEGQNLENNITITAVDGFELTTTSGVYGVMYQPIVLIRDVDNQINDTIFVHFSPTTVQTYHDSVSVVSSPLVSYLEVNGRGEASTQSPSVILSVNTIDFGDVEISQNSTEKAIVITGSDLLNDITITIPEGPYRISRNSGEGFAGTTSIVIQKDELNKVQETIYVRFSPTIVGEQTASVNIVTAMYDSDVSLTGDGIEEGGSNDITGTLSNVTVSIYPNPAKDRVNLIGLEPYIDNKAIFKLVNLQGKTIWTRKETVVKDMTFDAHSWHKGYYMLIIQLDSRTMTIPLFVN